MSLPDQFRKELDKECHQKDADVHAVVIGVRGDDYLVIAQFLQSVFNIQGMLEEVEFLIFIDDFTAHAEGVQRLARRKKAAWVSASRAVVMEPEAEMPSVMKRVVSPARECLEL